MRKHLITAALGLSALIFNPFYACNILGYTYAAPEMKAAVEGTWTLTTPDRSYVFHVEQAKGTQRYSNRSMVPSAHACGSRTFVASASACIDSTTMPVVVTSSGETTEGVFSVSGKTFVQGDLVIEVAGQRVEAIVKPDGTATTESGTLTRTAR